MAKNSQRKLMKNRKEFLGAYSEHYRQLRRIKEGKTEAKKAAESKVEKQFNQISEKTALRNTIIEGLVIKAIKLMRNKRSGNRQGWRAEWIKNVGDEMTNSLVKLFNGMEIKNTIPHQWNQLFIRSLHKKGLNENRNNQRGIFLTNIVSKVYKKVRLLQN